MASYKTVSNLKLTKVITIMKTLKEFQELNEMFDAQRISKQREFKHTEEADDFSSLIQDMLKSKAMLDWAKQTSSKAVKDLNKAITTFDVYVDELQDEANN